MPVAVEDNPFVFYKGRQAAPYVPNPADVELVDAEMLRSMTPADVSARELVDKATIALSLFEVTRDPMLLLASSSMSSEAATILLGEEVEAIEDLTTIERMTLRHYWYIKRMHDAFVTLYGHRAL